MQYILDTNVVSELRKGERCNQNVRSWFQSELIPNGGAISVVSIREIRKGIELISGRDYEQAERLSKWLQQLKGDYADRILPVTTEIAEEWGRLNTSRPLPAVDSFNCCNCECAWPDTCYTKYV